MLGRVHPLILVAVAAAVGGAAVYSWRRNAALREGLANLARANGWTFSKRQDAVAATWRQDPFGEGFTRRCRNVVQGTSAGLPFIALDYQYSTRSGDDTQTHPFAVTAVQLAAPMPPLSVTPEHVVSRLLGGHDIELESEDFNRRFRVKAQVPKFAYDVLTARTMEMLLARPPMSWHFEGRWLVCFAHGDLTATVLLSQLDTAKRIVAGIPAFVWTDVGAEPPPA
jgi:hypothetical protein